MNIFLILILMIINTIMGALGSLLIKKGSEKFEVRKIHRIFSNYFMILGLLLYFLAAILFIFILRYEKLSVLYPLTAMTYIWVALLSIKYLKEHMNYLKWIGILAIIAGIFFITL